VKLSTNRTESQQHGIVVLSRLFDVIDSETRVEDRVEELGKRARGDRGIDPG
jgi:hypothetical protein